MQLRGQLVLPDRLAAGVVAIEGGRIAQIHRGRAPRDRFIAPGLIDLHLWGEPACLSREEVRGGTTSFLASIGPLPAERLLAHVAAWAAPTDARGARCLGIHLEGPWVNVRQAGALNVRAIREPGLMEAQHLWRASQHTIRRVTVAPECVSRAFIRWWTARGVVMSCGHTAANYHQTKRRIADGIRSVTHLWNKMGSPHQRRPGAIGACLEDPRVWVSLLVDGKHLHPVVVKLIHRIVGTGRLFLVTDSTRTVALKEDVRLGLRRGQFRGKLAGTRLTMMEAVRNLIRFTGVTLPEAVRAASLHPARLLGLERHLGSLRVGTWADLVVFERRFRVLQTIVGGHVVYER